ncbi:hypothetical protein V8F20_005328 [Naviculisporaceae sp. PSN 640]
MAPVDWLSENADTLARILRELPVTGLAITNNHANGTRGGTGTLTFGIPEPLNPNAGASGSTTETGSGFPWWSVVKWVAIVLVVCCIFGALGSMEGKLDRLTKRLQNAFPDQEVDVEAVNGDTVHDSGSGSEEGVVDLHPETVGADSRASVEDSEEKEALLRSSK